MLAFMILVNTKCIFVQCLYTDIVYWVHKTLVFKPINFNKFNKLKTKQVHFCKLTYVFHKIIIKLT